MKAGKVWYHALTQTLRRDSDFSRAAAATVDAAGTKLGRAAATVVREAWKQVGIEVRTSTRREPRAELAEVGGSQQGRRRRADPRGSERRNRRAS